VKDLDALKEALSATGLAGAFTANISKMDSDVVDPMACTN